MVCSWMGSGVFGSEPDPIFLPMPITACKVRYKRHYKIPPNVKKTKLDQEDEHSLQNKRHRGGRNTNR